jgi:NifB/MoaA-like Fe-S oxidoreductase
MKTKYKLTEQVRIKKFVGTDNEYGRIKSFIKTYDGEYKIWVANLNMPYMGTVSDLFYEHELEKK